MLIFDIRTCNILPQYYAVFDDTFSTVEHTSKVTVPGNWKTGIGALRDHYTGKFHSFKIVAYQQTLKHSHTQGGLERGPT